mmetsp:Transcript_8297/g.23709  ORF Transcript_8297/g.23709 Transcript_8297/m.23709 type:complete len:84 (+) Transcript_8297:2-253(+)
MDPHTGNLGTWRFSRPGRRAKCYQLTVDFFPHLIGCRDHRHLLRARLSDPEKQRWKSHAGPLRKAQEASSGPQLEQPRAVARL